MCAHGHSTGCICLSNIIIRVRGCARKPLPSVLCAGKTQDFLSLLWFTRPSETPGNPRKPQGNPAGNPSETLPGTLPDPPSPRRTSTWKHYPCCTQCIFPAALHAYTSGSICFNYNSAATAYLGMRSPPRSITCWHLSRSDLVSASKPLPSAAAKSFELQWFSTLRMRSLKC